MKKVIVKKSDLGDKFFLSPEYWYSNDLSGNFAQGVPLTDIVNIIKKGSKPKLERSLILDTGDADKGLLKLTSLLSGNKKISKSHKKIVSEGSVIVSRLRPYLRQVSYIPYGIKKKLNIDDIYCSTEFYILEPSIVDSNIAYLVPWLLSVRVQDLFNEATVGGHHPRFSEDLLMGLTMETGFYDDRESINETVENAVNNYINAQLELEKLIC